MITDKTRWKDTLRMPRLWQRQEILAAIRHDLVAEGFLEIETPLLVKGTCPDIHIESVTTPDGYLVTSTEYQIKRMIIGGFEKLFTLTKNFRAHDRGRYHSAEFTMLEWARAHESLDMIEEDAIRFIRKAFKKLYPTAYQVTFRGHSIDIMNTPWERLTVRDAFKTHLGLDNLGDFSYEALIKSIEAAKFDVPKEMSGDKYMIMSYLFDKLQVHLGNKTPTFLREWPAYLTTSAPMYAHDPSTAQRSELYIAGIEIADGFPFLTDAVLQQKLFAQEQAMRKEQGKLEVALDDKFLESLKFGMPNGAGMAMGVDRLVMVLLGAERLADVQAFDWDEV